MGRNKKQEDERKRKLAVVMQMLDTGKLVPMWKMARELEVSPRSVNRYVASLRQMGLDIGGMSGHGGGLVLRKHSRRVAT